MEDRTHLPVAACFHSFDRLPDLGTARLVDLAEECARWLKNSAACHQSMGTPVAKTLWAALVQGEVDHVERTHGCLLDEIASRRSG